MTLTRLALFALLFAASSAATFGQTGPNLGDLAWLAGRWSGSAGNKVSDEQWMEPAGGSMIGMSRTLAGGRAVSFEFLRIEKRAEGIYYIAQPGGRAPTEFKLTRSSDKLLIFENREIDFPKMITYRLEDGDALTATVEGVAAGNPRKLEFHFRRASK